MKLRYKEKRLNRNKKKNKDGSEKIRKNEAGERMWEIKMRKKKKKKQVYKKKQGKNEPLE